MLAQDTSTLRAQDLILLTSDELARKLKVSSRWVEYNRKGEDAIPYIKQGRLILYDLADIIMWLNRHKH